MAMFNFGAFAGGLGDGYRKQNEDIRKQKDQEYQDKERKRVEEERASIEAEVKAAGEAYKTKRAEYERQTKAFDEGQNKPVIEQSVRNTAAEVTKPVDAGLGSVVPSTLPEHTSFTDAVDQSKTGGAPSMQSAGLGAAVPQTKPQEQPSEIGGLDATTAMRDSIGKQDAIAPVAVSKPKPMTDIDFNLEHVSDLQSRLFAKGHMAKAAELQQIKAGFMAEKIQGETKQRETAALGIANAVASKNPAQLKAAFGAMSDLVHDGNDVKDAKFLPDGTIEVSYGDGKPVVLTPDDVMAKAASLKDSNAVFNLYQHAETNKLKKLEINRKSENDDRHYKLGVAQLGLSQAAGARANANDAREQAAALKLAGLRDAVAATKPGTPERAAAEDKLQILTGSSSGDKNRYSMEMKADENGKLVIATHDRYTGVVTVKPATKEEISATTQKQTGSASALPPGFKPL